ncbi:hypothetical protein C8F04DRAFT_1400995 [Mycena alexandri]|uniref:MYND-type domain-containing protein n=1 Tax=Mycena alexandri TaxID=1745969 RepID=A0AAD6SB62_9AGAR|nr:hypothetical protein C8F04DRAFT_1400995 [Mycena alexandri]
MHPALRLSNLNRLPPAMRRVALAACSADRSAHDLGRLRAYLRTLTDDQKRCMVPAFYFNLDPDEIPGENGFDPETMSPVTESAIERAWSSLQSLYIIDFPSVSGLMLGPVSGDGPDSFTYSASPLSVDLLMFAGTFSDDQASYALIKSTPGFWVMLGEAWLHLTQSVDPLKRQVLFGDLSAFIQAPEAVKPDNLAEIIEGVGGTFHELARVATLSLALLVPRSPAVMDIIAMHVLAGLLQFLKAIDPSLDETKGPVLPLGAFGIALISQNVVRVLTNALCAATRSLIQDPIEIDYTAEILRQTFNFLAVVLVKSPGYQGLPMALKFGLLRAVATCMQISGPLPLQQCMNHWVGIVLPTHLIHHAVLRALGPALEDIVDLINTNAFQRSEVYEKWIAFSSLAHERLQILKSRFSDEISSLRVCDNLECLIIQSKTLFERCSGCLSLYYCCRACQVSDWSAGGHHASHTGEASKFHVSTRDRGFFRALMNHDYQRSKTTLLQGELLFRHAYPGEPYFLLYDYTEAVVKIAPQSLSSNAITDLLAGVEWTDIVSRVARSRGRMRLDVMVFLLANEAHWFAIPFRSHTARVDATLERLANELPKDRNMWDVRHVTETLASLAFPAELETH